MSRCCPPLAARIALVVGLAASACARSSPWPQFLGPDRDGSVDTPIVRTWGDEGPPILWRRTVGEGYAAPSFAGGRLVLFHRLQDQEIVEAIDPRTGRTIWRTGNPTAYRDSYGWSNGPRAAPAVIDGVVYTYGTERLVQAIDLDTGTRRWQVDVRQRFRTRRSPYGAGSTPLVARGKILINVGGADEAGIIALDTATGDTVWTATDHGAGYSTPVLLTVGNEQRAFFFTQHGLVNLDPDDGTVCAELPWRSSSVASVNAASPVVVGDQLFVSATYGTGAALFDVRDCAFEPVWSNDDILSNHYAASVLHNGILYGFHGRQPLTPELRAVDAATGELLWREERFGAGSLIIAGDTLVILHEDGELILADASRDGFRPRVRAQIFQSTTRAYPALANGILYARDEQLLVAIDLRPDD